MGFYIKGVTMPKDRQLCIWIDAGRIFYKHPSENEWHISEYTLVEVPPHGRLIDADTSIDLAEGHVSPGQTTISAFLLNHIEGLIPRVVIPAEVETLKKTKLEIAKRVIEEYFKEANCGIFNCRSWTGDQMVTIYDEAGLTIDICYYYSYFEVFGLSDEDFKELEGFYNSLKSWDAEEDER